MSLGRTIGVGIVGLLLTIALVGSTVLWTAHVTVLDPDFVTDSIEEEGGYEFVVDQIVSRVNESTANNSWKEAGINLTSMTDDAIREEYLASETERNVHRLYGFLHGNTSGDVSALNDTLYVDVVPLKEDVSAAVERTVRNLTLEDMLAIANGSIDLPGEAGALTELTANESSYETTRAEFRDWMVDRVYNETYQSAQTNESRADEVLATVIGPSYDPSSYTHSEKVGLIEDNEAAVKNDLRSGGNESAVNDGIETLADQYTNVSGETELERSVADVQTVLVRGLTETNLSYENFSTQYVGARADLATSVAGEVDAQLDEQVDDRIYPLQELDASGEDSLGLARSAVGVLDTAAIALPALIGVLVGVIFLLTRSLTAVSKITGLTMTTVGLPAYLSLGPLQSTLESTVASRDLGPEAAEQLVVGLAGQFLDATGDVALFMTIGGLVLVGTWLGSKFGLAILAREKATAAREWADVDEKVDRIRDKADEVKDRFD